MPWNKIEISQGPISIGLILSETGVYEDLTWRGTWWYLDKSRYWKAVSSDAPDFVWKLLGANLEIGNIERSGYEGKDTENIYKGHVTLSPVWRKAEGKLSVALPSGDGNVRFHPGIPSHTSGLDMGKPMVWRTTAFGTASRP